MSRRVYLGGGQTALLNPMVKTSSGLVAMSRSLAGGAGGGGAVTYRDLSQWPFAADDPFNIGIGNNALWSGSSDALTAFAHGTGSGFVNGAQQSPSFGIPVWLAAAGSPTQTISGKTLLIPSGAVGASGSDGNADFLQPKATDGTYQAYGFWRLVKTASAPPNTYTASAAAGPHDLSQYSTHYDVRASSVMQIGGLIRPDDITQGAIRHALAVAMPTTSMTPGPIWPASTEDSGASTGYTAGANGVHMGMVLGIPTTTNIAAQGLTSGGLMLAAALQQFGAIVVDTGGSGNVLFFAEDEVDRGVNTPAFTTAVSQMNSDMAKIVPLLRVLSNQQTTQATLTASNGWGTGSSTSLAPAAQPWV